MIVTRFRGHKLKNETSITIVTFAQKYSKKCWWPKTSQIEDTWCKKKDAVSHIIEF